MSWIDRTLSDRKISKILLFIIFYIQEIAVGVLDSERRADLCKHHFPEIEPNIYVSEGRRLY